MPDNQEALSWIQKETRRITDVKLQPLRELVARRKLASQEALSPEQIVEVTQADQDAAAALLDRIGGIQRFEKFGVSFAAMNNAFCGAFARHRIDATTTLQARIAKLDAEAERWVNAYQIAHAQACENGATARALRARIAKLEGALETFGGLYDKHCVTTGEPDRIKWEGAWHTGPLATAYLQTLKAISVGARQALNGGDDV